MGVGAGVDRLRQTVRRLGRDIACIAQKQVFACLSKVDVVAWSDAHRDGSEVLGRRLQSGADSMNETKIIECRGRIRIGKTYARRARVAWASALLGAAATAQACSMDWTVYPAMESVDGGPMDGDGTAPITAVEASADDVGTPDVADVGDAAVEDANWQLPDSDILDADAGGTVDAATCAQYDCDCDDDGWNDLTKPGCELAGGLNDCDDLDARTHPTQTYLEATGVAPRLGDWNCQNGVEKFYAPNVSCGLLSLGACAGVQGFQGDPKCGEEGAFVQCEVAALLLCVPGPASTRRQACK